MRAALLGHNTAWHMAGGYAVSEQGSPCPGSSDGTLLMHIAAAFHNKILCVWGNSSPELGMYPYLPGEGSEILEVKGLPCRPCSKLGYHECPKKHFRCMNDIPEDRIINWVKSEF